MNLPSNGYNRQQQAILTRVIFTTSVFVSRLGGIMDWHSTVTEKPGMRIRKTCSLPRGSDVLNGSKEKVLNCADNWNQDSEYETSQASHFKDD